MASLSNEAVKRLNLGVIGLKKPIKLYTVEELVIFDNLLIDVDRGIDAEISKINHDLTELESAKDYLKSHKEKLHYDRQMIADAIVNRVKNSVTTGEIL
jgi:hypothetical protein